MSLRATWAELEAMTPAERTAYVNERSAAAFDYAIAVDTMRAILHRTGIGCRPNVVNCRASHRSHAQAIVDELRAAQP